MGDMARLGEAFDFIFVVFVIMLLVLVAVAVLGHAAFARGKRKLHLLYVLPLS